MKIISFQPEEIIRWIAFHGPWSCLLSSLRSQVFGYSPNASLYDGPHCLAIVELRGEHDIEGFLVEPVLRGIFCDSHRGLASSANRIRTARARTMFVAVRTHFVQAVLVFAGDFGYFSVLLNNGKGRFVEGQTSPVSGGAAADFNGDGIADLALGVDQGISSEKDAEITSETDWVSSCGIRT